MPELPEVETMRRGVLPIVGSRIVEVAREPCRLKALLVRPRIDVLNRRCAGRVIEGVGRLGKRVTVELDNRDVLVFEPRMTGLVLLADPPNVEHLRVRIDLAGGPEPRLWYWDRRGLGSVRLFTAAELRRELIDQKLGVDALEIGEQQLREALRRSRREIKVALLDQRAVAGIGNLYASEILHLAGVHPEARCDRLSRAQWTRIHAHMVEVLEAAIEHEGSTLSDGTYRNALNKAGGYQNHHRVYDRSGLECPTCGEAEIVRIVQSQRATFFCRRCQKKRG